jgi:hypothetical protein
MSSGPNPTGGESLSHYGSQMAEGGYKIGLSAMVLVFVPVLIFSDLLLGPFFLWSQAVSQGIPLDYLSVITPILFSITLTGLQYALWQTAGEGGPKWIRYVAWGVAIADTLTDIGGLNWALTQNPEAGKYFFPIGEFDGFNAFAMYVGGLLLLFHERLLRVLLEVKQGKVNDKGKPVGLGNAVEAAVVFFSGVVLNFADFLTKNLSVWCIIALDIILTPQLVENTWPPTIKEWVLWGISFAFTVVTFLMWRWCAANGGVKAVIRRAKTNPKHKFELYMVYGFFGFLAVDTLFDMSGYNKAMYNVAWPWIDDFSPSWILTMLMLIALCGMGDILFRTLFSALGDKARRVSGLKAANKPKRRKSKKTPGSSPPPGVGGFKPPTAGAGPRPVVGGMPGSPGGAKPPPFPGGASGGPGGFKPPGYSPPPLPGAGGTPPGGPKPSYPWMNDQDK